MSEHALFGVACTPCGSARKGNVSRSTLGTFKYLGGFDCRNTTHFLADKFLSFASRVHRNYQFVQFESNLRGVKTRTNMAFASETMRRHGIQGKYELRSQRGTSQ